MNGAKSVRGAQAAMPLPACVADTGRGCRTLQVGPPEAPISDSGRPRMRHECIAARLPKRQLLRLIRQARTGGPRGPAGNQSCRSRGVAPTERCTSSWTTGEVATEGAVGPSA